MAETKPATKAETPAKSKPAEKAEPAKATPASKSEKAEPAYMKERNLSALQADARKRGIDDKGSAETLEKRINEAKNADDTTSTAKYMATVRGPILKAVPEKSDEGTFSSARRT